MLLYLMRHGRAEHPGPGQPDAQRSLTGAGRHEVGLIARALAAIHWMPKVLLCSPYLRARQTADLIAPSLNCPVAIASELVPGFILHQLDDVINQHERPETAFVVTHQPSIGQIVGQLTGSRIQVAPATIIALETSRFRPGAGFLRGCYDPRTLSLLGHNLAAE